MDKDKGEGEFWIMSISDDQDLYSFHLDSPGVRCLIKCQLVIKIILKVYILLCCPLNGSILTRGAASFTFETFYMIKWVSLFTFYRFQAIKCARHKKQGSF